MSSVYCECARVRLRLMCRSDTFPFPLEKKKKKGTTTRNRDFYYEGCFNGALECSFLGRCTSKRRMPVKVAKNCCLASAPQFDATLLQIQLFEGETALLIIIIIIFVRCSDRRHVSTLFLFSVLMFFRSLHLLFFFFFVCLRALKDK